MNNRLMSTSYPMRPTIAPGVPGVPGVPTWPSGPFKEEEEEQETFLE